MDRIPVSRIDPSVTTPAVFFCARRRNLMSPPMESNGPTDEATRTVLESHISKASYSGDLVPVGLSAAMSGRCGTKRRVIACPAVLL